MEKVRVDKWLWSVRIFKSRTMATNACKSGKVKIEGTNLKPSYPITIGERLEVKKNGFNMLFEVKKLLKSRVGAPIAVECYENLTPEDEMNKYKNWYIGKAAAEKRDKGTGRPTKRDRRKIDDFKDDENEWDWFDEDEL